MWKHSLPKSYTYFRGTFIYVQYRFSYLTLTRLKLKYSENEKTKYFSCRDNWLHAHPSRHPMPQALPVPALRREERLR
jgi:hypothetical protein